MTRVHIPGYVLRAMADMAAGTDEHVPVRPQKARPAPTYRDGLAQAARICTDWAKVCDDAGQTLSAKVARHLADMIAKEAL